MFQPARSLGFRPSTLHALEVRLEPGQKVRLDPGQKVHLEPG
jgi:hypothetical protein